MKHQKRTSRRLRSKGACHSVPNIFETQQYLQILPKNIYKKITGTPTINCDKINDLVFHPGPNYAKNLIQMKKATALASKIQKKGNIDRSQQNIGMENQEQISPKKNLIRDLQMHEYKQLSQNDHLQKKGRKNSDSINGQYNLFGEQVMGNMNFLKELDQFLLQ